MATLSFTNLPNLLPFTAAKMAQLKYRLGPMHILEHLFERFNLAFQLVLGGLSGRVGMTAHIDLSTNPTHQDTLTIGGDTYEFLDPGTGTVVADDAHIGVEIGVDAAATLANLLAAINGTAAEHATLTMADTTTPALSVGTEPVRGYDDGGSLLGLNYAGIAGGDVRTYTLAEYAANMGTATPSISLSDGLTATVAWNYSDLSHLEFFNPAAMARGVVTVNRVITAADAANGSVSFALGAAGSNPAIFVSVRATDGSLKFPTNEDVTWSGGLLTVTVTDTIAGTDVMETDVLSVMVVGAPDTEV